MRVGVPVPLDRCFDYAVPAGMAVPAPGTLVRIPFGAHSHVGVVWEPDAAASPAPGALKPLAALPDAPPLGAGLRRFIERAADYTLTPFGAMLRLSLRCPGLGEPAPMRAAFVASPDAIGSTPPRARVLAVLAEHGGAPMPPASLAQAAGVSTGVLRAMAAEGALGRSAIQRDAPYPPLRSDAQPAK